MSEGTAKIKSDIWRGSTQAGWLKALISFQKFLFHLCTPENSFVFRDCRLKYMLLFLTPIEDRLRLPDPALSCSFLIIVEPRICSSPSTHPRPPPLINIYIPPNQVRGFYFQRCFSSSYLITCPSTIDNNESSLAVSSSWLLQLAIHTCRVLLLSPYLFA